MQTCAIGIADWMAGSGDPIGMALSARESPLMAPVEQNPGKADDRLLAHSLASIGELVSVTDLEDRFTFVNQAFLDTYGYTREEVLGRHVSLISSPNNPPHLHQQILDRTRTGSFKGELLNRAKDGREFPISLTTSHVRDETGRVLGLVGIAQDISTRKAAEEALAARARQLEALRALSNEITRELDLSALLRLIHERATALVGAVAGAVFLWDEADQVLIPRAWSGLGDWVAQVRLGPGEGLAGTVAQRREGMISNEYRVSPYASPILLERSRVVAILAEPLLYRGRLVGVITVHHEEPGRHFTEADQGLVRLFAGQAAIAIENARLYQAAQLELAERQQVEAMLRESEQRYRSIVETAAEGIWMVDADWQTTFVNSRMTEMLGYSREEMLGRTPFSFMEESQATTEEALAQGRQGVIHSAEAWLRRKDGRPLYGLVNSSPIFDAAGHLVGSFAMLTDLTPRKRAEEALVRRTQQVEAVRAVSAEITRELDLTRLLELIHRRAAELFGARSGAVFLLDEATGTLVPRAWQGLGEWMGAVRVRLGESVVGTVAERRAGMLVTDYRTSPYRNPVFLERTGMTSVVAEPLLYRDRVVGVLSMDNEGMDRAFTEGDREILALFAAQAAIAIENARLHGATVRRGEELGALLRATRSVMAGLDLRETLDRILKEASHIAGTPHVKVLLVDRETQILRLAALAGRPVKLLEGFQIPVGIGHSGIVAATGKTLYVPDCPNDPRNVYADQDRELGLVTYLGLPIMIRGEVLGVLTFNTEESRQYSPEEIAYLTSLADMAAIAIENARLYAATERGAHEARSLYQVAHSLTTSLEPGEVLDLIAVKTTELLGTPHAQVVLWDETSQTLQFGAAHGTEADKARGQQYRLGEGLNGIVAQTRAPLIVNDYQAFAHRVPGLTELTADIGVPLLYRGRFLGVLNSHATKPGWMFTDEHLALLTSFADQAAVAIENARLYDAVQRQAAELEARVKQRTAELEEALRVKALFLANMSHELRTPLNFVIGFSELLRDGTAGPLTPKQAGYLDRIHTGGKRLLELVTHLLEMTGTDSQPASFQLDRLVLTEILDEVLAPLAATAQAKSVALETALHPGLPVVVADRRKFSQILHHLVTNALRFTSTGGRVTVSARRVSTAKGEEAELAVQDTGIGIRPEDLERVFRPFEQADGSDTRRYGGAGLGLALARRLTELHGGRIWAESEGEGRGARFLVRLPLLPAPPPPQILVVEDEVFVREALRAALMAEGYGVDGVCSGIEAQERLAAGLPNLLVLDIGLPDVDGRDLLKQLRADARTRDLPILILTGLDSIQPHQVLTLGADEFLTKPVSPQVLSATVARLLRRPGRESRGEGTGMSAAAQDSTGSRT